MSLPYYYANGQLVALPVSTTGMPIDPASQQHPGVHYPVAPTMPMGEGTFTYNPEEMAEFIIEAGANLFLPHLPPHSAAMNRLRVWLAHVLRRTEPELHSIFLGLTYYETMISPGVAATATTTTVPATANAAMATGTATNNPANNNNTTPPTITINGIPQAPPPPTPPTGSAIYHHPHARPDALLAVALMLADKVVSDRAPLSTRGWVRATGFRRGALNALERAWLGEIGHRTMEARWEAPMGAWVRRWWAWVGGRTSLGGEDWELVG